MFVISVCVECVSCISDLQRYIRLFGDITEIGLDSRDVIRGWVDMR